MAKFILFTTLWVSLSLSVSGFTLKCKPDEVYNPCMNKTGCHPSRTCQDLDNIDGGFVCFRNYGSNETCQPGCLCQEGYLRDASGTCIPVEKCPNAPTCAQGEIFRDCSGIECRGPGFCLDFGRTESGAIICKYPRGCYCKPGYARNDNDICVPENELTLNKQCSGKPHQYFDTCPSNCVETCDQLELGVKCVSETSTCTPRCKCAQGYYKDADGKCIQENQCPKQCGVGEVWDICENSRCYYRRCGDTSKMCMDAYVCMGGCRCKNDWVRNNNGVCVPMDEC